MSTPLDPRVRFVGLDKGGLAEPIIATAIHAGHDLRSEVRARMALEATARRREEDGGTAELATAFDSHVIVDVSRFEVDLNRPPAEAVYRLPEHAWGLQVWSPGPRDAAGREPVLPDDVTERSLAVQTGFLAALQRTLEALLVRHPRLIVLDIHSYNHRREGPRAPGDDATDAPQIDVPTVPFHEDIEPVFNRDRWAKVVDAFVSTLRAQSYDGAPLDCRADVRWRRGYFSQWLDAAFGDRVCALMVEVKKTHVDEWTGELEPDRVGELRRALRATREPLLAALGGLSG